MVSPPPTRRSVLAEAITYLLIVVVAVVAALVVGSVQGDITSLENRVERLEESTLSGEEFRRKYGIDDE